MQEPEFWQRLEFRICAEFRGFADHALRSYWCDGLIPEEYDLAGANGGSQESPSAGAAGRSAGSSR